MRSLTLAEIDGPLALRRQGCGTRWLFGKAKSRSHHDCLGLLLDTGETEVEDLDLLGTGEHHVVRLQVAVNDPLPVRRHQDRSDLSGDPELLAVVKSTLHPLRKAPAGDQLEDEEIGLGSLDVLVDLTDVRMGELGEDAGLAEEAGFRHGVEAVLGADHLQGDLSFECLIVSGVDLSHPSRADQTDDAEVLDLRPRQGRSHPRGLLSTGLPLTRNRPSMRAGSGASPPAGGPQAFASSRETVSLPHPASPRWRTDPPRRC